VACKVRKTRINFTLAKKSEYAKLMVEENCFNKQIMELSGAASTAFSRREREIYGFLLTIAVYSGAVKPLGRMFRRYLGVIYRSKL